MDKEETKKSRGGEARKIIQEKRAEFGCGRRKVKEKRGRA